MPFVEAIRQLKLKVDAANFCLVHVSMVPTVGDEQKSKPTQHSVKGNYKRLKQFILSFVNIFTNRIVYNNI